MIPYFSHECRNSLCPLPQARDAQAHAEVLLPIVPTDCGEPSVGGAAAGPRQVPDLRKAAGSQEQVLLLGAP